MSPEPRPAGQQRQQRGTPLGLPLRAFLFTLDQVSEMLAVPVSALRQNYLHFDRKTMGAHNKDKILARNIAPPGADPEWRVAEQELTRWLRRKGFRLYDRNWIVA